MARIVAHNDQYVTLGVTDRNLQVHPELQAVTFEDHNGTAHTVHAHKSGPFTTPEDIVAAFEDGTLHPFEDHKTAAAFERDRGNAAVADRLDKLAGDSPGQTSQHEGGAY